MEDEFTPRERGLLIGKKWAEYAEPYDVRRVADEEIPSREWPALLPGEIVAELRERFAESDDPNAEATFWGGSPPGCGPMSWRRTASACRRIKTPEPSDGERVPRVGLTPRRARTGAHTGAEGLRTAGCSHHRRVTEIVGLLHQLIERHHKVASFHGRHPPKLQQRITCPQIFGPNFRAQFRNSPENLGFLCADLYRGFAAPRLGYSTLPLPGRVALSIPPPSDRRDRQRRAPDKPTEMNTG